MVFDQTLIFVGDAGFFEALRIMSQNKKCFAACLNPHMFLNFCIVEYSEIASNDPFLVEHIKI